MEIEDGEIADTVTPDAEAREKALREAAMQSRIKRPAGAGARKPPPPPPEAGEDRGKVSVNKDTNWDEKLKRRAERFGSGDSQSPVKREPSKKDVSKNGATEGGSRKASSEASSKKKDEPFGVIPHQGRGSEQIGARDGASKKSDGGTEKATKAARSDADRSARTAKPNPNSTARKSSEEGGRGSGKPSAAKAEEEKKDYVPPHKRAAEGGIAPGKPPKVPRTGGEKKPAPPIEPSSKWLEDEEEAPTERTSSSKWLEDEEEDVEARNRSMQDKIAAAMRGEKLPAPKSTTSPALSARVGSAASGMIESDAGSDAGRQSSVPSGEEDNDAISGTADTPPGSPDPDMTPQVVIKGPKVPKGPHLASLMGCRSVEAYTKLNAIAEGTYGKVYRAKDNETDRIVALKQIKMGKDGAEGFPITALREIDVLLKLKHPNVIEVHEMCTGSNQDKVFMVMEYMEHDLKMLMGDMRGHWSASEVKCLMKQLLEAMRYCHDNWVIHRDIKTSNLLMNNKGVLKVCDFGLARPYGDPIRGYTQLVVTLWYRAPELLLGCKEYSTEIDVWSLGCVFAELLNKEPIFMGRGEMDQIDRIFKVMGVPSEDTWPGVSALPAMKKMKWSKTKGSGLRKLFPVQSYVGGPYLTENGVDLLARMLELNPKTRLTCEEALNHPYFQEAPQAKDVAMMPTFPSNHEGKKVRHRSPKGMFANNAEEDEEPDVY